MVATGVYTSNGCQSRVFAKIISNPIRVNRIKTKGSLAVLPVTDLVRDDRVCERVSVIQSKTTRWVQFELSENTRDSIAVWFTSPELIS